MDKKTVFIKTAKGESEGANLSSELKRILSLVDNKSTVDELAKRAPPSLRDGCRDILGELEEGGYINDKNKPHHEPKITVPKFNPLKMFSSKSADKRTVYVRTAKGEGEGTRLSSDVQRVLSLIDNQTPAEELTKSVAPSLRERWNDIIKELVDGGYIRDKSLPYVEPKISTPKSSPLKMFTPEPAGELDFHTPSAAPAPTAAELAARQKAEEAAQLEAAVAAAKARAVAEAAAKAEAQAKQDAEIVARGKALAEADAAAKAEAKAKQEAVARMQAEQEAARNKAALEAALKVRAEIEAAARAQQVAEAKVKQEAAARMQAQAEAARAKAALEVAAREKAEAEVRIRAEIESAARAKQEAETKAKKEAEAARLKVEQEAARVKAELAAAAKAKQEAEAALQKAEQEAARIRAEMAAAQARAEADAKALAVARAKQEMEDKARREAETARLKAEHEAALIKAEQEAVAKVRAEAEARYRAESEAKLRAETEVKLQLEVEAKLQAEAEARQQSEAEAKLRADAEARAIAEARTRQLQAEAAARIEAEELAKRATAIVEQEALLRSTRNIASPSASVPAYEIQLDGFMEGMQKAAEKAAPVTPPAERAETVAEAEQSAAANAESEANSLANVAAEMARLKEESEAARRKFEEDARRKEEEQALAEEQAKAWAEAEHRAKMQALIEVEQAAQQTALSQAKAQQKPVVRSRKKPLPLGKIAFGLIILALVVAVVLPYVYPLEEYVAPLEQRLSAQLRQPVRIGSLSASSLPPKLQLQNVTVGTSKEVKVASIALNFDLFSLFSDVKIISNADIQDVSIQGDQLEKQVASLKLLGSNAQYPVQHLSIQRLKIVTDEVALPGLSGIADIDAQGAFNRVSLHSADDKLGIELQANQGRWQLGVNIRESSLFFLPDITFSDLIAKGDLNDGEINFTELDAHLYNGILLGSAKLNWRKGWQIQGHLEAKTFDLDKMFPKFHIEGELYGEGAFSLTGAKLSQLDDNPRLDGSFSVKKGTVSGFDMVETARLLSRENMVGGRTHFDDLIGLVLFENHVAHFRQLKLISGMLSANGAFEVSSSNQLGGNFNAEIKMRAGNNNLILYGTLAEPKLRAGN